MNHGDLTTFLVFNASFPDDSVENEKGDIVVPAGQAVTKAICGHLERLGHEIGLPIQHSFYGWEFQLTIRGRTISVLLQQPGPWLLILELKRTWRFWDCTGTQALASAIESVNNAIIGESRFSGMKWMTPLEYNARK